MLSWVEHEKSFRTSGPDYYQTLLFNKPSVIYTQQQNKCDILGKRFVLFDMFQNVLRNSYSETKQTFRNLLHRFQLYSF